ncbi:hypothetical protein [Rufibacter sp. LB8]|uniref:hypothetical protein n=1 Tax=Rufibacter sp. LB8 TaxID=2777781 RepID=UPI00178C4E13|nr:hypothetical protein [Rufibacter sp. LB8]
MKNQQPPKVVKALSPDLRQDFLTFLEEVPPGRLNRTLRVLLLDYLMYNKTGLPHRFPIMMSDLCKLTEVLDTAQRDTQGWHKADEEFE